MQAPEAGGAVVVVQSQFGSYGLYVAVLAHGRRVVGGLAVRQYAAVAEVVLTVRIDVLRIHRQRKAVGELYVDAYAWVGECERTEPHSAAYVYFLALPEVGFAGSQVHIACRTELACRLHDVGFLTVVELDFLHVVQRETSQVHLSVLGITQLYAVVIDGSMLTAHRAHVDGLDTTYAAVVFELYAGEIAQRVRYGEGIQSLQFYAFECLGQDHVFLQCASGDGHLLHLTMPEVRRVGQGRILRVQRERRART